MASPSIVKIVGAVAIAAVIAAATEAANHSGKSERQCRREATSLKWNPNDEADQWGFNQYMARCQYGVDAETAARIEHRLARGDRLDRREQQVAQRRKPLNEFDRRALAQAEPRYRQQGVKTWDFCRDLAAIRAVRAGDEEDQFGKFVAGCMSGAIPR